MSQYRDDRAAAGHRIEALEAAVAERDAELARQGAALAERDEEILRLERELDRAGIPRARYARPANAAHASRLAGTASVLALMAAGMGVTAMRPSVSVGAAPPPIMVSPILAPIHADPLVGSTVDWTTPVPDPLAPAPRAEASAPQARTIDFKVWDAAMEPPTEDQIRRQLEAKVFSGHGSVDEIRMLRAICAHQGDRACRNRATALLGNVKR